MRVRISMVLDERADETLVFDDIDGRKMMAWKPASARICEPWSSGKDRQCGYGLEALSSRGSRWMINPQVVL